MRPVSGFRLTRKRWTFSWPLSAKVTVALSISFLVYIIVGLAALWQLIPLARMLSSNGR